MNNTELLPAVREQSGLPARKMPEWKRLWQLNQRIKFKESNGFSTSTHYRFNGVRTDALKRDGYRCVKCGMTDQEHRKRWNKPITVDHKDKNEKNNILNNLQTLCLSCHGSKDISRHLIVSKIEPHREFIMASRRAGESCNSIARKLNVDCHGITKWVRRWNGGKL